jgi:hypothetical protein
MKAHPLRHAASVIAGSLALLIGPLSLLVLYLTFTVLNAEAFTRRVVGSLDDPRVAEFAAERITDLLIQQRRDLTALRPVIIVVTRGIVSSPPFRALLRPAARKAHEAVFSSTSEQILLSVPDAAVLLRSTLANLSPAAAQKLPGTLAGFAAKADNPAARAGLRVLRTAHAGRQYARAGVLLSLILLVATIALAPSRRSALLSSGAATAAAGLFLGGLVPVGRLLATAPVGDPVARAAVAGMWDAFMRPLWFVGAVVAALGITLVFAATSTLERFDSSHVAREAWRRLTGRRETTWGEALRVAGLGLGGLLIFLFPSTALMVAGSALGVVLFLLGLQGLVRLTRPVLPQLSGAPAEEVRVGPVVGLAFRVAVILLVGLAGLGLVLRLRPRKELVAVATEACNGSVALCDRPLNRIVWAGAHNAMGSADNPSWMFPNQDLGIPGLLDRGVRVFMLDVHYGRPFGDKIKTDFEAEHSSADKYEAVLGPEGFQAAMRIRDRLTGTPGPKGLYLCHGLCELGASRFDSTLTNIVTFLATNPGEVVMLDLEDYVTPEDVARAVRETGLIDFVYRGPLKAPLPTLRQMIASDGRVLVFGEHDVDQIAWYHAAYDLMQETPYTFHSPSDFSCRPNRGAKSNPLLLINHWIETTPAPLPSNAERVNAREALLSRARACARERGMLPNILAVDFAGTGDLIGAVQVLNGLDTTATTPPTKAP